MFPLETMQNIYYKFPHALTKGQAWALKSLFISHHEHFLRSSGLSTALFYLTVKVSDLPINTRKGLRLQGKM